MWNNNVRNVTVTKWPAGNTLMPAALKIHCHTLEHWFVCVSEPTIPTLRRWSMQSETRRNRKKKKHRKRNREWDHFWFHFGQQTAAAEYSAENFGMFLLRCYSECRLHLASNLFTVRAGSVLGNNRTVYWINKQRNGVNKHQRMFKVCDTAVAKQRTTNNSSNSGLNCVILRKRAENIQNYVCDHIVCVWMKQMFLSCSDGVYADEIYFSLPVPFDLFYKLACVAFLCVCVASSRLLSAM